MSLFTSKNWNKARTILATVGGILIAVSTAVPTVNVTLPVLGTTTLGAILAFAGALMTGQALPTPGFLPPKK